MLSRIFAAPILYFLYWTFSRFCFLAVVDELNRRGWEPGGSDSRLLHTKKCLLSDLFIVKIRGAYILRNRFFPDVNCIEDLFSAKILTITEIFWIKILVKDFSFWQTIFIRASRSLLSSPPAFILQFNSSTPADTQKIEKGTIENRIWEQQKCGWAFSASATTFLFSIVPFFYFRLFLLMN